jgi:hypothetical protein
MISENDVRAVLSYLPPDSFLHSYVTYAERQTVAPLAYHLAVGLTILGTTCPLQFGTPYAGMLHGNLFAMIVGRSGDDNKSSALGIGRSILFDAAPNLIGDMPGSPEGLIDSLTRQPIQLLLYSEMGTILANSQKGYMEPIKAMMTDLYDCSPQQRAKANRQIVRVDNPRLSMLGACSVPYLERYTDAVDWTGGFLSRWLVMHAKKERVNPDPVGDTIGRAELVDALTRRGKANVAGWCTGLDEEAKAIWYEWYYALEARTDLPSMVSGVRSRVPAMARKIALLLGWDFGSAHSGEPWLIGVRELGPALMIAELHLQSILSLSEVISEHGDARLRRTILDAIPVNGLRSLGEIVKATKLTKKKVQEALDSLCEEGTVQRFNMSGGSGSPHFTRVAEVLTEEPHTATAAEIPA